MSVKDYKGREIIVSIKDDPDAESPSRRPGMIPPSKPPLDHLPRRNNTDTSGIFLDVYDMAADADGADRNFRHDGTIAGWFSRLNWSFGNENYTNDFNSFFGSGPFTAASYLRVTADNVLRFGSSGANFVGLEFSDTRGFKTGGGGIDIPNGSAWNKFNSGPGDAGTAYTKITNGSYSDPEVALDVDRDGELYLAPRVFMNWGNATVAVWGLGTGSPPTSYESYLANYFFEALPRSWFLDNPAFEAYKGTYLLNTCFNNYYSRGSDTFPTPFGTGIILPSTADFSPALKSAWRTLNQTRPGSRLEKNVFVTGGNTETTESPTSFPAYVAGVAYNNDSPLPYYTYTDAQDHARNISPGHFLAALKLKAKGSTPEQWFYFYRKVSTVAWSVSCRGGTVAGGGTSSFGRYTGRV
jgi:hypothetical protein